MDPLEQWALAVSCHPNAGSSQPARLGVVSARDAQQALRGGGGGGGGPGCRRWFTFSAFFAVATIAREADEGASHLCAVRILGILAFA